jgi:hypothetical protein
VQAPEAGHRLAVHQLEDPLLPVAPLDVLGAAVLVLPSINKKKVNRKFSSGVLLQRKVPKSLVRVIRSSYIGDLLRMAPYRIFVKYYWSYE